ncbi:LysR family transcriptional regulator [Oceanobacillus polygoni]|uniref:DNA-binding transcriptional LysR family regulator n=1 Tax=Oceanobacillus polygoni TaxID=1235259 RepID=A0A9X0YU05_9BACI|nr:LysR family transcriptional regulator [Oceanobacillus polygoni]MBP2078812.1 DNA-binding transcriptional LysR family regulator [Oceanobacillus polygoni]
MSISKYKVLMEVLEQKSLTKAADTMGYTQSGISHTINSLEEEFGFELIVRGRTGAKLTKNGEQVITTIREILKWNEYLEQQIAAVHGVELGIVRIGTFTSVSVHWLPSIIKKFQQDFPSIEIKLVEGDYREIEEWILNGVIDCGFISAPTRNKFDVIPLHKDKMLVILPPEHHLGLHDVIHLNQIEKEPFIMPRQGSDDDINRVLRKAPFKPNIKFIAGDDYAIMAMVESGLGISILPELVLKGQQRHIHKKELKGLNFRSLGIAVNSKKNLSPATKKFLTYVQDFLDEGLDPIESSPNSN